MLSSAPERCLSGSRTGRAAGAGRPCHLQRPLMSNVYSQTSCCCTFISAECARERQPGAGDQTSAQRAQQAGQDSQLRVQGGTTIKTGRGRRSRSSSTRGACGGSGTLTRARRCGEAGPGVRWMPRPTHVLAASPQQGPGRLPNTKARQRGLPPEQWPLARTQVSRPCLSSTKSYGSLCSSRCSAPLPVLAGACNACRPLEPRCRRGGAPLGRREAGVAGVPAAPPRDRDGGKRVLLNAGSSRLATKLSHRPGTAFTRPLPQLGQPDASAGTAGSLKAACRPYPAAW